ncbi:MAG: FliA/WhiG family RNA polymerase sigma factor [Candidatus Eiseniibacteriota bacterium]
MARRTTTGSRTRGRKPRLTLVKGKRSARRVTSARTAKAAKATRTTRTTKATQATRATKTSRVASIPKGRPAAAAPRLSLVPRAAVRAGATPSKSGANARPAARPAPLALVRPARPRETNARATATVPVGRDGRVAREDLLSRYTPLIKYVVERLAVGLPKSVDHEDLMSAGVLGLLDAYEKFDSSKGTKFETYAVWRIKGAVLDQLRSLDWASRSVRRKAREVEASTRRLDQRLGRAATEEEIAREAKMPLADYHRLMDQVRGAVLLSLDEVRAPEEGDALGLADLIEDPTAPDVLARLEEEETRQVLLDTLNRLPEQERLVVALYYYEHMTLREIGLTLGISESRVSQVHSRAVLRLRSRVRRALACA